MTKQTHDVIIIGGGLAGLTAACYLAREGKNVVVLEKRKSLGGRASTKVMEGSFYNLGPHALYKKGKALRILKDLGIKLNGGTPSLQGKVFYDGQRYELPSNLLGILRTKLLNMKEKKEYTQIMLNIGKIDPSKYYHLTLEQWVETNISSEKNKKLFYMFCRLASYVNAPELVNAGAVLSQLKMSLGGALYINRGWQSIIEQLREKAKYYGVNLLCKCKVKEIEMTSSSCRVSFIKENEQDELKANKIIAAIPPSEILSTLKGIEQTRFGQLLKESAPVKAACLDITLTSETHVDFALDMNQSYYYSNHSKAAKLTYHPNHQVVHVMKYLKPNETASHEQLLSFLDCVIPNWQDQVVSQRFLPNLIVSYRCPIVSNEDIALCAGKEFPGLHLAGEWVSNEFLLAEGALITAKGRVEQILRGV